MQITKILKRIGISIPKENINVDIKTLTLLQESYILNIPYENLDFVLHNEISFNILKIYEKIVNNNRGGICYESNTLFIYLLTSLGFDAHLIFAKVEDLTYIAADHPHVAIIVTIDDKEYLVDVANGENVRVPMLLGNDELTLISEDKEYKLTTTENLYSLLFKNNKNTWQTRYTFNKKLVTVKDFEDVFGSKDKSIRFSSNTPLLVTQGLKNGRLTLTDEIMCEKHNNEKKLWNISLENRAEVLRDYFSIII